MKILPYIAIAVLLAPALKADDQTPILLEAELNLPNQDALARSEDGTSGGSYSSHPKAWNPLFWWNEILPPGTYTIWARARGTNICLKALDGSNNQTELQWAFGVPEDWKWVNLGTYPSDKLAAGFLLIRADAATDDAGLDCVVIDPSATFDPETDDLTKLRTSL